MAVSDLISAYSVDTITTNTTTDSSDLSSENVFLQMLITQLQYQDPLEPISNEDMVAQLATFNTVDELVAMNEKFDQLLYYDSFQIASTYVGKEAYWFDEDGNMQTGVVDYMEFSYDEPVMFVGNQGLTLGDIFAVQIPGETMALDDLQRLIGYEVTWTDSNDDVRTGIVEAASLSDGTAVLVVDGEEVAYSDVTRIAQPE